MLTSYKSLLWLVVLCITSIANAQIGYLEDNCKMILSKHNVSIIKDPQYQKIGDSVAYEILKQPYVSLDKTNNDWYAMAGFKEKGIKYALISIVEDGEHYLVLIASYY